MEKSVESLPGATVSFFSNCSFTSTLLELNKLAFERMLQEELLVKVVLKFPRRSACFPLLFFTSWGITAELKFTVFYGPMSMKERSGAPLLGLAKSVYYKGCKKVQGIGHQIDGK